jgi:V/A-type H+-transporting ATPase subunit I
MALVKMEKVHICAMKRDRKQILELLQRRGTVEVRDCAAADEVFQKTDTSAARALFERSADTAGRASEILSKYQSVKKPLTAFLRSQTPVSMSENEEFILKRDEVLRHAQQIVSLDRQITEARADILRVDTQLKSLEPWLSLCVPQSFSGTKKTAVFIGLFEGEHSSASLTAMLAEANPSLDKIHIEIVSSEKTQTCVLIIALKNEAQAAENTLRSLGFAKPPSAGSLLPREELDMLEAQKKSAYDDISSFEQSIAALAAHCDDIRYLEDYMTMRAEKYAVIENLSHSSHTFILQGYVPWDKSSALRDELTANYVCTVDIESSENDKNVPVALKNNKFAAPTESVLESYSLPGKGEIDPINIMSIFYYFMFGMMFSDAGYGLIMVLVCGGVLLTVKNIKPNWTKNLWMFFWCGVSTVLWGIMFSGYFGDLVTSVAATFFGKEGVAIPPLWFAPLEAPMQLLMFCLLLGIIHLSAGYAMKGINCAVNKDYAAIFYDAVFPAFVMYPLIIVLMGSEMFEGMAGFKLNLPPMVTNLCFGVSLACMAGIILTSGRESRNWGKRILKGIYGLYNILAGWISDTLSYSRLLALGLSTGVIASVFNSLGSMAGGVGGIIGVIIYLAIFLVGHALNFGINVLGAYVHSNRLEYVEFFGKFYEGGGEKYTPFGMHTKYYIIEEEH